MGADEGPGGRHETGRPGLGVWLRRAKLICVVVVAVLVLIVLFQNNEPASFDVLFWHPELPLVVLLLGVFATGGLMGAVVVHLLRRWRG